MFLSALALKDDKEKENKRHTMSHPPDHIPELDSPRQSRSPIKKDKKERVSSRSLVLIAYPVFGKTFELYHFPKSKTFYSFPYLHFLLRTIWFLTN